MKKIIAFVLASVVATLAQSGDPMAQPEQRWDFGQREDGRYFAGSDSADGNRGVYVMCTPSDGGEIVIWGLNGPAAELTLVIDSQRFADRYALEPGGWHATRLGLRDPVLSALQSGSLLSVQNEDGRSILSLGLTGSSEAISRFLSACR